MSDPIALISNIRSDDEASYLSALASAMPAENVVLFRQMSAEQRARVQIAIVANPDPANVAALPNLVWVQSLWAGVEQLVTRLVANGPPIVRMIDPEMSRTMAEAVLAWTYYLQRDMPAYLRQQRQGLWHQYAYRKPSTLTVGILGLGSLGTARQRQFASEKPVSRSPAGAGRQKGCPAYRRFQTTMGLSPCCA